MSKALWFAEYERLYNEALDRGGPIDEDALTNQAMHNLADQLGDRADMERKRRREED